MYSGTGHPEVVRTFAILSYQLVCAVGLGDSESEFARLRCSDEYIRRSS